MSILQDGDVFIDANILLYTLSAFRILLENDEDRLLVVFNRGLILMTEVYLLSLIVFIHLRILIDWRVELNIFVSAVLQHPAHDVP